MNPILFAIYGLLKIIVRVVMKVFYPQTTFINREDLDLKGPTLVLTNHPNTLMDALNAALWVNEPVYFLANAGLFAGSFQRWFFETFYCIPIERPKDRGKTNVSNQRSFARCTEHLAGGGHIYIAPEGTSFMERRLRDIKTGPARIALGAEETHDFELDIHILPIGLNYETPHQCGHSLVIHVGSPISPRDYRETYSADHWAAVKELTEEIESRMKDLLIHTQDEQEDHLLRRLETLLRSSRPVDPVSHYLRTRSLLERLKKWRESSPKEYEDFSGQVEAYFSGLDYSKMDDRIIADGDAAFRRLALYILPVILGIPLFLYGWINNALPYHLPKWINERLDLYVGYAATVKAIAGLISFPFFYAIQTWLVAYFWNIDIALIYLASLPITAWLTWKMSLPYRHLWRVWHWRNAARRNRDRWERMKSQRTDLWNKLTEINAR